MNNNAALQTLDRKALRVWLVQLEAMLAKNPQQSTHADRTLVAQIAEELHSRNS